LNHAIINNNNDGVIDLTGDDDHEFRQEFSARVQLLRVGFDAAANRALPSWYPSVLQTLPNDAECLREASSNGNAKRQHHPSIACPTASAQDPWWPVEGSADGQFKFPHMIAGSDKAEGRRRGWNASIIQTRQGKCWGGATATAITMGNKASSNALKGPPNGIDKEMG
jgi:hypothetical protein